MLKSLQVNDYALIEKINIDFGMGLNIITGETGAGKSILIDAMSLLLGGRASTESVRKGAAKSIVEGIFEVEKNKKIKKILEENEVEFFPELILRREISLKGSNRNFINDTPVPLSLIKEVGNLLVDLHGQHEHQTLLRTETHIDFLDGAGSFQKEIEEFKNYFKEISANITELNALKGKENSLKEKKDFYSFQIKEIDQVSPEEGEEEKLNDDLKILENSEKLMELTTSVYQSLYDSETSAHDLLAKVQNELEELNAIDKSFGDSAVECESALTLIKDISEFIRNYNSKIELEPSRLNEIRDRLGALNLLKKKYGGSIKSILEYRKRIGEEYDLAENFKENIQKIEDDLKKLRVIAGDSADKLSKKRKEFAKKIAKEVEKALSYLGISNAKFVIEINQKKSEENSSNFILVNGNKYKFNSRGYDEVEFYISTNLGEDPKPLAKVASGGEVSRIMLALKTILANNDKLPLLIFDEIDTGVSGRVAQKVGLSLKSLAKFHQIIAITHLPQIAGLGDNHFIVEKSLVGERVISSIKKLDETGRVKEVAKLMSGEEVTITSLEGAKELMGLKN
jgi:DNA repair protein RecN (Recombination protein N)